jgi:hypothetical protein
MASVAERGSHTLIPFCPIICSLISAIIWLPLGDIINMGLPRNAYWWGSTL